MSGDVAKVNLMFATVEPLQLRGTTFKSGREPVRSGKKGVVGSSPLHLKHALIP